MSMTKDKAIALSIFAHSRMSNKYTDFTTKDTAISLVKEDSEISYINNEITELVDSLAEQNLTIESLNKMKNSYYSLMITYYYEIALSVMKKHMKVGDDIIDALIGLAVFSYITEEKSVGSSDKNPSDIIAVFEKQNIERKLMSKMMSIGFEVAQSVEKANFARHVKQKRKRKNR